MYKTQKGTVLAIERPSTIDSKYYLARYQAKQYLFKGPGIW